MPKVSIPLGGLRKARGRVFRALAALVFLSLPACAPVGVPVEQLATAGEPRGVVYFSLADFCSVGFAGLSVTHWEAGGAVHLQEAAGKELTYKSPATGLYSVFKSEFTNYSKVYRYELPPGTYAIRSMSCQYGNTTKTFYVSDPNKTFSERLTSGNQPNDKRVGVGYFTVKSNEVISGGSLEPVKSPVPGYTVERTSLKVRPFNETEMQRVRNAYPDEARKMAYRPVLVLPRMR